MNFKLLSCSLGGVLLGVLLCHTFNFESKVEINTNSDLDAASIVRQLQTKCLEYQPSKYTGEVGNNVNVILDSNGITVEHSTEMDCQIYKPYR